SLRKLEQKFAKNKNQKSFIKQEINIWEEICNNHMVTYIEELEGEHDVYDITVDETHNFIANEICVHNSQNHGMGQSPKRDKKLGTIFRAAFVPDEGKIFAEFDYRACEPRLLAYYSRSKVLLDDFRNNPDADPHQAVANASCIYKMRDERYYMTIIKG